MRRYFSGNNLEHAVMQAARHFGIQPEELAFRPMEKKHGFVRSRRAVVIEVDPDAPRRAAGDDVAQPEPRPVVAPPAHPEEAPARREAPASPEPPPSRAELSAAPLEPVASAPESGEAQPREDLPTAARGATRRLLRLAGLDLDVVRVEPTEDRVEIDLAGADEELVLAEGGRTLLAIQHLLPRLVRSLTGERHHVRVDCAGFHENRRRRLEELARREAERAVDEGRARTLSPMPPDERRIVHLALNDEPGVETESRGSGFFKRVTIRPVGDEPAGPAA